MSDRHNSGSLQNLFDELKPFSRPPVDTWHPDQQVDFDLVIRADGSWVHEGGVIKRHELVKLFSTVLAYRENHYFLVTPSVAYRIQVEDMPFQILEVSVTGERPDQCIWLRTDMDEVIALDEAHPLDPRIAPETGEPSPVVLVRDGLSARLKRSAYYQLTDLAEARTPGSEDYGVRSCGVFFPLM